MTEKERAYYNDVLRHHGILGMRWDKKNGPPYPLGASDHSASEKKAGWRKSLDKSGGSKHTKSGSPKESDSDGRKRGLTDKQKRAIKIGAAAVATALATYGTYRLVKSGKLDPFIDKGKEVADKLFGKGKAGDADFGKQTVSSLAGQTQKVDRVSNGIKKLARPESLEETLRNVNPHLGDPNFNNNCSACGIASFLRSKGFEVTAKSTGGKQQILGGVVEECFRGAKVIDGSAVKFGRSKRDASEMLLKRFGENASGVVSVQWKKDSPLKGGHIFNWTIKDGVVTFFDGQTGRGDVLVGKYWQFIDPNNALTIARLDEAEIDFEALKRYVE